MKRQVPAPVLATSATEPGVWPRSATTSSCSGAERDGVAVLQSDIGGDGEVHRHLGAGEDRGAGRGDDIGERAVVVPVPVRGEHRA